MFFSKCLVSPGIIVNTSFQEENKPKKITTKSFHTSLSKLF